MATPQDVISTVQDTLDSNIDDPNSDRSGTKWIYTIPINFDMVQFPRIHISNVSSTHTGLSVGSTERWVQYRFQVTVFNGTNPGNKMDVDGDGELETQSGVVDYLVDRVIDIVNSNQATWQGVGSNVYSVVTVEEQRLQDERNKTIQHNVDCIIRMKR